MVWFVSAWRAVPLWWNFRAVLQSFSYELSWWVKLRNNCVSLLHVHATEDSPLLSAFWDRAYNSGTVIVSDPTTGDTPVVSTMIKCMVWCAFSTVVYSQIIFIMITIGCRLLLYRRERQSVWAIRSLVPSAAEQSNWARLFSLQWHESLSLWRSLSKYEYYWAGATNVTYGRNVWQFVWLGGAS